MDCVNGGYFDAQFPNVNINLKSHLFLSNCCRLNISCLGVSVIFMENEEIIAFSIKEEKKNSMLYNVLFHLCHQILILFQIRQNF